MKRQSVVNQNGVPLTIVLSCLDSGLQLRLTSHLRRAGYSVVQSDANPWAILHRIYQCHAPLLILQTNLENCCQKEIEYAHLLHCKVLLLQTHSQPSVQKDPGSGADGRLALPVDPDSVLGMIRCLFCVNRSAGFAALPLEQLLDRWQMTRRQPNRRMMEQGILLTVEHPDWVLHITKDIYPRLAQRNHLSITAVEQRLRRAIKGIYLNGRDEVFLELFGADRPTNSQFFARVAQYLFQSEQEARSRQEKAK